MIRRDFIIDSENVCSSIDSVHISSLIREASVLGLLVFLIRLYLPTTHCLSQPLLTSLMTLQLTWYRPRPHWTLQFEYWILWCRHLIRLGRCTAPPWRLRLLIKWHSARWDILHLIIIHIIHLLLVHLLFGSFLPTFYCTLLFYKSFFKCAYLWLT